MQSNPSMLINIKTGSSILQRVLSTIPPHTHKEGKKRSWSLIAARKIFLTFRNNTSESDKREMFLPAVTPWSLKGLRGGGMKMVMLQPREQGSYELPVLGYWQSRIATTPQVSPPEFQMYMLEEHRNGVHVIPYYTGEGNICAFF